MREKTWILHQTLKSEDLLNWKRGGWLSVLQLVANHNSMQGKVHHLSVAMNHTEVFVYTVWLQHICHVKGKSEQKQQNKEVRSEIDKSSKLGFKTRMEYNTGYLLQHTILTT